VSDAPTELALRVETALVRAMLAVARRDALADAVAPLRERLEAAEARLDRVAGAERPLDEVAAMLGLEAAQLDFWWTAIALTAEPRMAVHAEALAGSSARRGLTVASYAQLFELDDATGRELALWLGATGPLVANGLLVCTDDSATLATRPYAVPTRVIAHVAGETFVEPRLTIVEPNPAHQADDAQERALAQLAGVLGAPETLVVVEGPSGGGRTAAIARAADGVVAALDVSDLGGEALAGALLALRRETVLRDAVPVIEQIDGLGDESVRLLGRALDQWPRSVALTSAVSRLDLATSRPVVRVAWPAPGVAARARLWRALGGVGESAELDALAQRYPVGPGTIARAVRSARLITPEAETLTPSTLAAGLRHNIAEKLGSIARRVDVTQTWDDLVVADDTREQIRTLVARVRYAHQVLEGWGYRQKLARGAGVAALFSGLPGTGKTMVAGLIARELDLELYQVDLSQVVSKWVGETEKQLARVFDVAEQGHALLLFDEADALFGQRTTETRGAVDRYANLEVNYLLQRVEAFGGVTILTTNLDTAIDRALKRRLAAHIVFDLPDEEERTRLWQRLVQTTRAPLAADLDLERLARDFPKMSGANIRNASLAAAFLAAADEARAIDQEHLARAARVEYRSMGHILADRRGR
jgi:AAA+ superfamily predicted ATPase